MSDHPGTARPANHLAQETSPYLRQHRHNPVDWWPWGQAAITRARAEDKPMLVSVGYAACHWCHVMERESFEDPEVAALMNAHFVCVKVDREERPDVDRVYMRATQLLTGSGGWPMNVFCTPDLRPFFGGTYFPPSGRWGRPSWRQVVEGLAEAWRGDRASVLAQAEQLTQRIAGLDESVPADRHAQHLPADEDLLGRAARHLAGHMDRIHGGFGDAPKFPHCTDLALMLRHHASHRDDEPAPGLLAIHTLRKMSEGGIHDHLAGGFARYATDAQWLVPHFEKMLYDNAQLAPLYLEAWRLTGERSFEQVAARLFDWLEAEMTGPEGGLYATLDADSEGVEGKFYVFTQHEIDATLGDDAPLFSRAYGVRSGGNWHDPHGDAGGNILHVATDLDDLARVHGLSRDALDVTLSRCRAQMLACRALRIRPGLDDKRLAGWNGLAVSALAAGARLLHDEDARGRALRGARRCATFLLDTMWRSEARRLWRVFQDGRSKFEGNLEDHAYAAMGLADLAAVDPDPRWIDGAHDIASAALSLFSDASEGGFFFAAPDDDSLLLRTKSLHDESVPSPPASLLGAMLRIASLRDLPDWTTRVERELKAAWPLLAATPSLSSSMLLVLDAWTRGPETIVLSGSGAELDGLRRAALAHTALGTPVLTTAEAREARLDPALVAGREGDDVRAYVCRGGVCLRPVTTPRALCEVLSGR